MYGSNSIVIANVLSPVQDSYPQHVAKIFLCPRLEAMWPSELKFVYNLISGCFSFLGERVLEPVLVVYEEGRFWIYRQPRLRLQLKCWCILGFCHSRDKLNKLIGSEKLPLCLFHSLFHQHLPINFLQQFALHKSSSKMMSRFRSSKI